MLSHSFPAREARLITLTELAPLLLTNAVEVPFVATPQGAAPTGMVPVTDNDARSTRETEFEPLFATIAVLPAVATPDGAAPKECPGSAPPTGMNG